MTRRQIHEIALRKRPHNRKAYEDIHLALAEEVKLADMERAASMATVYFDQHEIDGVAEMIEKLRTPRKRTLWQRIKGWFA